MGGFCMTNDINRFVSHEYRSAEFEHMLQEISSAAAISPELVRKYTKTALEEWEHDSGHDVLTLFTSSPGTRSEEISKMLNHFRDHLRPIIFSQKKLDMVMKIASNSLETMYKLY